jgi:predicted exporter
LLAVALCSLIVARARYSTDLSAFLPATPDVRQQLLVRLLRDGPSSQLILVAIEGSQPDARALLSQALAASLRSSRLFAMVANGEPAGLARDRTLLFAHRYLFSPAINPEHFTVAGLGTAMNATLAQQATALAVGGGDLLAHDPTGEIQNILDWLDTAPQTRTDHGVWVSAQGERAILLARTVAAGSDTDGQQQALEQVRTAFARLRAQIPGAAPARLVLSGPGVFATQARTTIKGEVRRLAVLSTLLIGLLLMLVYRSVVVLVLGFLPVVSGALAGLTAVALGFSEVYGITLGFGITLIGEAVDYSIYLFVQASAADRAPWTVTLWPTIRLGMLTSVCGFASLLPSAFPGLAQLGLYTVAGLIGAALVTRFVLPALLPADFAVRPLAIPLLTRAAVGLQRARWALLPLALLAVTVLWLHHPSLWNRELSALSPVSQADQRRDALLRADLGAADVSNLVIVTAASSEAALRGAELASDRLAGLVANQALAGYDSPSRYLPSLAIQQARRASLPEATILRARTLAAASGAGFNAGALEPFLTDVATARSAPLLTRADLSGTTLGAALDALLVQLDSGWIALLPLRAPASGVDDARVAAALAPVALPDVTVTALNLKAESDLLYQQYLNGALRLSAAGLAAMALLLWIAKRSLLRMALILLPLGLAALTVAAGFALAHRPMNLLHLIGLLLIFAVGSNYALFFDRGGAQFGAGNSSRTLSSLLLANVTAVIAFGVLSSSAVPVLSALGATVAPGAFLALLFSAMLARGVESRAR